VFFRSLAVILPEDGDYKDNIFSIPLFHLKRFGKDIILLISILWLFFRKQDMEPGLPERSRNAFFVVSLVIGFFLAVIAIRHLPFIDFRAYKEGTNIEKAMKPSEPLRYKYIMEKDGEQLEFTNYPTDTSYKFIDMVPINPEALPKITDYSVWNDEGDFTQETFTGRKMMIIIHDIRKVKNKSFKKLNRIINELEPMGIEPIIVTASGGEEIVKLRNELKWPEIPYFYGDATVLKTMIRSNPGIILMNEGTVIKKWHFRDVPSPEKLKEKYSQG
jgi:hypothetical protein